MSFIKLYASLNSVTFYQLNGYDSLGAAAVSRAIGRCMQGDPDYRPQAIDGRQLARMVAATRGWGARGDIDPAKLPPKLVAQRVQAMTIDWKVYAQKEKTWCDRWKAEVFDVK